MPIVPRWGIVQRILLASVAVWIVYSLLLLAWPADVIREYLSFADRLQLALAGIGESFAPLVVVTALALEPSLPTPWRRLATATAASLLVMTSVAVVLMVANPDTALNDGFLKQNRFVAGLRPGVGVLVSAAALYLCRTPTTSDLPSR